jgi:raffinose/stachyose/melibiose transport system permease protein
MLWLQMGFAYIVFIAGLSRLNPTLLEAAHLDGAGRWARLRWIIAPSLKPEIFVILVFLTVGAIKVFAPVYYLTGGDPYGSTSSPATFAISNFYGGRSVGYGSAITTTLAVVIAVGLGVTFWIVNRIRARGEQP